MQSKIYYWLINFYFLTVLKETYWASLYVVDLEGMVQQCMLSGYIKFTLEISGSYFPAGYLHKKMMSQFALSSWKFSSQVQNWNLKHKIKPKYKW